MHEKLIREINGEIADAAAGAEAALCPQPEGGAGPAEGAGMDGGLEQMLPIRGRLECAHVLELCSCVLPRLAPRPERGVAGLLHPVRPGADVPRSRLRP